MIEATIIISIIFIAYNLVMWLRFGQLWSISEGYYKLEDIKLGWIFSALLAAILFYMVTITMYTDNWLFFLAAGGAGFTGTARLFQDKRHKAVHYIGSGVMILAASIGCVVSFGNWWALYIPVMSVAVFYVLYLLKAVKNPIYWVEIAAFMLIILGIVL